jgi:hypothetical protein
MSLYKLRDWIQEDKLNINYLCQNECPGAIQLIEEKFLDKIVNDPIYKQSWYYLSKNSTYEAVLLIENGCPYGDEITLHAAEIRSVKCLKYLHKHGCKFDEMTTFAASKYGNLECLKYAVENGAPKHPETCRMARGSGYGGDACYNYAIANGFPE